MIKWLKLILLVILLSCKPKKGHITLGPGTSGVGHPGPTVTSLQVTSDQLIINGFDLQGVTAVAMTTTTRAAFNKSFNVLSASINQVVAVAVDSMKIPMDTALNLILSTAKAQSSIPIEFNLPPDSVSTPEIEDGAVTNQKIEDGSVTTSKIGNYQVTYNKLQPGPLTGAQTVITWNPATQQYILAPYSGGGGGSAGVTDITLGTGIVGQNPANPPTVDGLVPIGVDVAAGGDPLDIKIPFFNNENEIELNWGSAGIAQIPAKILFGNATSPTSHYSISNQSNVFTISFEDPAVKKLFEIDAAGNVSALGTGGILQPVCLEDGTNCPTAPAAGVTQIITTAPLTGSGTGIVTIGPGAVNTANNLVQLDSSGNFPATIPIPGVVKGPTPSIAGNVAYFSDTTGNQLADSLINYLNIPTMSSDATGQFQPILSGGSDKTQISAPYSFPNIACTDGQILKATGGNFDCSDDSGGVISFNTRNGVVTPTAGDYTASQITNVPFPGPVGDIDAIEVQAALDELSSEKLPKAGGTMIGTIITTPQNALQIGPTGEIRFEELLVNGTNYVGLKAPDNVATNTIWNLPSAAGSAGQVLATSATNTLYWTTITGGAAGIGDVVGPATSTSGNISIFADNNGKIIQDGGKAASSLVTIVTGPPTIIPGNLAIFNSPDGTVIQDSGIFLSRVVQGPPVATPTSTNQAIPIWNGTSGNFLSDSAFKIVGNILSGGTAPGIAAIGTSSTSTEACFFNNSSSGFPAICQSSVGKTKITSNTGQIIDFILGSATGISLTATATVNYGAIISNTNTANAIQINPYGAAANNTGQLRFMELTGPNYVAFKAPDAINPDVIWTLPAAAGASGTVLSTDATNALYWKTIAGGAGGIGDVVGPANSTNTNLASFSGATGKIIQDSGILAGRVVTGPGTSGIGYLASFSTVGGNAIQDTLIPAARIVQGATSTTNQAIPTWNGTSGNALSDSVFKIVGNILSGGTAPGIAAIGTSSTSTEACFFNTSSGFPAICQSSVGKTKVTTPAGQIMDFIVGATTVLSVAATGTTDFGTITSNTNTANAIQINPFGVAGGNTGEIRFQELLANGVNYVGLKAPSNVVTSTIWTLPIGDGTSGQALTTNGSGVLAWGSPVSSTIDKGGGSTLVTSDCGNTVAVNSAGSTNLTLTALPVGCVVNVIQKGLGVVTVVLGGGLSPQNAFGLYRTRTQYSVISIQVMDSTTAVISGDVN